MPLEVYLFQLAALMIALIGAVTDFRTGHIPNWITLPPLVVAPAVYGILEGGSAVLASIFGLFVCAFVPYLLFQRRAMHGGDVKLFAAIGALIGAASGIEAQFASLGFATLLGLVLLARRGLLLPALKRSLGILLAPFSKGQRQALSETPTQLELRLGPAIFAGVLYALYPSLRSFISHANTLLN